MKILTIGSKGAKVAELQDRLKALGFDAGPTTGQFDGVTLAAVRQFQATHADAAGKPLDDDGRVGPLTWDALLAHETPEGAEVADDVRELPDAGKRRVAILNTARGELGVKENPWGSNGGSRVDVYTQRWRVPWCALFVSWAIATALHRKAFPPHERLASVAKVRAWAFDHGHLSARWSSPAPRPGDLFLMSQPGGAGVDTGHGHCGFVYAVEPEYVTTIEGNCAQGVRSRRRLRSTISDWVVVA